MLNSKDGWRYSLNIEAGLSPWIVDLKKTEGKDQNHIIPGSIVGVMLSYVWQNPKQGEHKVTAQSPMMEPDFKPIGEPFGFNGWFQTNKGPIALCSLSFLTRIPMSTKFGPMELKAKGDAKGPEDQAVVPFTSTYPVIVEPAPRPDKETLLSYFGYILREGNEEKKFPNARNRKGRKYARCAIDLLQSFASQLDGDMQTIANEILNNNGYKNAVALIAAGEKKDQEEKAKK
jgi:hypothetical protein